MSIDAQNRKWGPRPVDAMTRREQQLYLYLRNLATSRLWKVSQADLITFATEKFKGVAESKVLGIVELLMRD